MTKLLSTFISLLVLTACAGGGSGPNDAVAPAPPSGTTTIPTLTKVYAYTASQYTNKVYGFSLDKTSGVLTPTAQGSIANDPLAMSMTPSREGSHLLTANYSGNSITSFAINPDTGELTLVEKEDLGAGAAPGWIAAHPKLDVVYVANSGTSSIAVLNFDPSTGLLTPRSTTAAGSGVTALAVNADATLLYSADQNVNQLGIYAIDSTGNLSKLSTVQMTAGSQVNAIVLSPDGRFLYAANWGTKTVSAYSVSGSTLTQIGSDVSVGPVSSGGAYFVQVSPDGKRLYSTQPYGNSIAAFDIDANSGAISTAVQETLSGAVNVSFWKDFAFYVRWGNSATPLPISTRSYTSAGGIGSTDLSATAGINGLYQLNLVEVKASSN